MASEIQLAYGVSGRFFYAVVRSTQGEVWNVSFSQLEAYNGSNWPDYAVPLTEQGTSGYYVGDFPAFLVVAGVYAVEVRSRSSALATPNLADPLVGTGSIEWSGTAVVPLSSRSSSAELANAILMGNDYGNGELVASVQSVTGAVGSVTGSVGGDIVGNLGGKVLGGGAATIAGTGVRAVDSAGNAIPTAAQVATAVLAAGDVDGFTLEQTLKLCLSALAGKLSGATTTTITIRAADDSKNRIVATVDSDGNRSAITLDAAG